MINQYTIQRYIEDHGFEAFINSDNSVSFWLPVLEAIPGDTIKTEWLITVHNFEQARIELGY